MDKKIHSQPSEYVMNSYWHILYCDASANFCPISEFIEQCQPRHQAKIFHFMNLPATEGPNLPRPYADLLRDGVHELQIKCAANSSDISIAG